MTKLKSNISVTSIKESVRKDSKRQEQKVMIWGVEKQQAWLTN